MEDYLIIEERRLRNLKAYLELEQKKSLIDMVVFGSILMVAVGIIVVRYLF